MTALLGVKWASFLNRPEQIILLTVVVVLVAGLRPGGLSITFSWTVLDVVSVGLARVVMVVVATSK